jgi:hypothetical protein
MIIKRSLSTDRAKNQLPPRGSSNGDGITNGSAVFAATWSHYEYEKANNNTTLYTTVLSYVQIEGAIIHLY